jgi:hypothetical protein
MHYMFEYYLPGYGWVLIDSTAGETPYETKRQIINRVCFPEDENDTKYDYIFPYMKGEERWLWIDNQYVYPYYLDCKQGSKSQMFTENNITTNTTTAEQAFLLTQKVFQQYKQYLGKNLTGDNLQHFQEGLIYQKEAINKIRHTKNIEDYIYYLEKAHQEYKKITL